MPIKKINLLFRESISVKNKILENGELDSLITIGNEIVHAIKNGRKLMLCGNGGSAADAQHLAAELLVRLRSNNNREGVAAIALAQDTSTLTACGNDFGFDLIYERMVSALGREGDVLLGITTSGNSENILLAFKAAKKMGIKTIGFLGCAGGNALDLCDHAFTVPSDNTGRIQEAHITAGHAVMEYIEDQLINDGYLHLQT